QPLLVRYELHLPANIVHAPSGESREIGRLALLTLAQAASVAARRVAIGGARPWMMQDVARLEILAITSLLEYQVFRKMIAVVADMQAGEEDFRRAARVRVIRDPEDAEVAQLLT